MTVIRYFTTSNTCLHVQLIYCNLKKKTHTHTHNSFENQDFKFQVSIKLLGPFGKSGICSGLLQNQSQKINQRNQLDSHGLFRLENKLVQVKFI